MGGGNNINIAANQKADSTSPIFDKEKEQNRLKEIGMISDIGGQVAGIARTQGELSAIKTAKERMNSVTLPKHSGRRQIRAKHQNRKISAIRFIRTTTTKPLTRQVLAPVAQFNVVSRPRRQHFRAWLAAISLVHWQGLRHRSWQTSLGTMPELMITMQRKLLLMPFSAA